MICYEEEFIPTTVEETQMGLISSSTSAPGPAKRGRKRKYPLEEGSTSRRKYALTEEERLLVNAREKQRTKITNEAFENLKRVIPSLSSDKLTKNKTLYLAIKYIDFLMKMLKESPSQDEGESTNLSVQELRKAFAVWRIEEQEENADDMEESIDTKDVTSQPEAHQNYYQQQFM
ncbi:PREDICTED: twist-related protein 2-like [Nicrophorus vespilloides]|uniref:Twist-related protein 2-like n=1 Tax=Nicrophorus vespilloides TaxID=110193 RepID=A0ABM1NEV9_NICVS|nr:PREDICTED: twist-related protein 2-like [Nicrophorus vespilloides]